MITQIEYNGVLHSDQNTKSRVFFDYFLKLMGTDSSPMPTVHWQNLYPSTHDLQEMSTIVTVTEIHEAIAQWPNNKSSGPDGFSGEFYKFFASMLVPDLHEVFKWIMETGGSMHPLNSSHIVLIPKKDSPTKPSDFRPISLLHGVQKLFSKILANRLQPRMGQLIMDVQTGFQKGRQISESYIYAQHLIHTARRNKMPFAMLKLDIKKAFDTISWDFILKVMENLGFQENWIRWIKNAVFHGSSQVLINGLLGKKIDLKRGVRQGDPLSPSLFIMALDFFARYLQKLTELGAIRLPFPAMKPCLLYADDSLLFLKPDPNQAQAIKLTLMVFQQVSGLAINLEKSEMLVMNTGQEVKTETAAMLNCRLMELPVVYLGIPLSDKRLPKSAYVDLLHRFSKRLGGWAARFLSIAGRLTLLNSIL